jgi:predicted Zn-dependent protease
MNLKFKILFQSLILACSVLGLWTLFQLIPWDFILKRNQINLVSEKKIGDLLWRGIKETEKVSSDTIVIAQITSLIDEICVANHIQRNKIQLHIIDKNEVNAFAMPGGHLIVYTGLISKTVNSEQLCGVLAHEIAHIELNHVVQKLTTEIGLTVLFSVITNGDSKMIHEIIHNLSSSSFSRSLEKEADIKAIDYLYKAHINPYSLAEFMQIMAKDDQKSFIHIEWFSTHPASEKRINYLKSEARKKKLIQFRGLVSKNQWAMIKQRI